MITDNCFIDVDEFISTMCQHFRCRDLGQLSYFLGLQTTTTPTHTMIAQCKYAIELLRKFGLHNSKPFSTPATSGSHLSLNFGTPFHGPSILWEYCGPLQFLTITRPYIVFAINHVFMFMQVPTTTHW